MVDWLPPTSKDPMYPLALALREHADHGQAVDVEFHRDDGEIYLQSTDDYFQARTDLAELEAIALDACAAPVLDVGSASGRIALLLQQRNIAVTAIDISDEMVAMMRRRGVADAECADAFHFARGRYATILLLMETIGLAGDLDGLKRLLINLEQRLTRRGQVICDSSPFFGSGETATVTLQMRFRDWVGTPFPWLYVDPAALASVAESCGLQLEIGYLDDDSGHYLARLRHLWMC